MRWRGKYLRRSNGLKGWVALSQLRNLTLYRRMK
nr:MAG TPA: hypothetical protein [Caudoviricetes sp.]